MFNLRCRVWASQEPLVATEPRVSGMPCAVSSSRATLTAGRGAQVRAVSNSCVCLWGRIAHLGEEVLGSQQRPMDKSHFIAIWGYCRQSCFITHSGITHCTSRFKLPVCARALLYRWNYSFMAAASENEVMLWWLLRLQVDLEKYSIL